jgi:hypothetical protein
MSDGEADREELGRLLEQLAGAPVGDAELDQLPAVLADFGVRSEAELLEQLRMANDFLGAAAAVPDPVGDAFGHTSIGWAIAGWTRNSLFVEGQEPVVRLAPEAYRTLGLAGFAAIAERALDHGYDPVRPEEAFWDALDGEWFALPDQEPAREAYVLAHPEEFAVAR